MKKLFLIIGAPGSGKTTDASLIAERNSDLIEHFSTGDLLRAEAESGSDRGKIIDGFISKGLIVPINIAVETITEATKRSSKSVVIFDGYPRSIEQMSELDKFLSKDKDIELVSVIEVEVSEAVARERVLGRSRGADDNATVFSNRMQIYNKPLAKIQSFYSEKNLLHKIDGSRDVESVVADMQEFIKSKI